MRPRRSPRWQRRQAPTAGGSGCVRGRSAGGRSARSVGAVVLVSGRMAAAAFGGTSWSTVASWCHGDQRRTVSWVCVRGEGSVPGLLARETDARLLRGCGESPALADVLHGRTNPGNRARGARGRRSGRARSGGTGSSIRLRTLRTDRFGPRSGDRGRRPTPGPLRFGPFVVLQRTSAPGVTRPRANRPQGPAQGSERYAATSGRRSPRNRRIASAAKKMAMTG